MSSVSLVERNIKNRQNFIQLLYTCALLILAFENITDSSVIIRKTDLLDNIITLSHTVCPSCGWYNGKQVKTVKAKKEEE